VLAPLQLGHHSLDQHKSAVSSLQRDLHRDGVQAFQLAKDLQSF
jgi:hypothetical protein